MTDDDRTRPVDITQAGPLELKIAWGDGEQTTFAVRNLRLACSCAVCVDEWTGEYKLDPSKVPDDVRPVRVRTVGRYALNVVWSDGHESGIYPFERLRKLGDSMSGGVS